MERRLMARIAVIGAGAIGSYYGARLAQAGHEVHFLMRSDYEAVRTNGLDIRSKDGDFHLQSPLIHGNTDEIGPVDWILCALKATAIEEARDLIAPCVGDETCILLLMNGLGLEDQFAEWFGGPRIYGGLGFTGINREAPGRIHHIEHGTVTLAHFEDDPAALEAARSLWNGATVTIEVARSLLAARWTKLLWNIPFNGLTVTAGGITTDRIMANPHLRAAAEALMHEVIAAGNADLAAHGETARLDAATSIPAMLTATEAMAAYRPSTMIDFVEGRPLEVDAIFGEPLRRAQALGVDVPYITLITTQIAALDTRGSLKVE